MNTDTQHAQIYDGNGDELMIDHELHERLVIVPDARPFKGPDTSPKLRLMWGQHLLDDLLVGRYRSLVCAVNTEDNTHGIIGQLANLLPTSQWDPESITAHARLFATRKTTTVIKYDMDMVEVLALLRPAGQEQLTLDSLSQGFRVVTEMIRRRSQRTPVASVSFLGAHANALATSEDDASEPSFETVLRAMHKAGFGGDVYPSPRMWECAPTAVFARYPFPQSIDQMRQGGY